MAKSQVSSFTSKGTRVSGVNKGTGTPLGHFDTTTGKVFPHPRIKANQLAGSTVTVTNPRGSDPVRNQRTGSIGMGGSGQRGRHRDV